MINSIRPDIYLLSEVAKEFHLAGVLHGNWLHVFFNDTYILQQAINLLVCMEIKMLKTGFGALKPVILKVVFKHGLLYDKGREF